MGEELSLRPPCTSDVFFGLAAVDSGPVGCPAWSTAVMAASTQGERYTGGHSQPVAGRVGDCGSLLGLNARMKLATAPWRRSPEARASEEYQRLQPGLRRDVDAQFPELDGGMAVRGGADEGGGVCVEENDRPLSSESGSPLS